MDEARHFLAAFGVCRRRLGTGSVPGTHELIFDGPFEQLSLTHMARDRRVFAEGALKAADWLIGRTGVFTMRDVLELTTKS